jgi:hypothetical protein
MMYQLWQSTDLGVRSTAQVVCHFSLVPEHLVSDVPEHHVSHVPEHHVSHVPEHLVSHVPEHRAKGLLETGSGSQGVAKPHVPVFAVKGKKVRHLSFYQVWLVDG